MRKRCPPSKTGIGSRLKIPSWSEMAAISATSGTAPRRASAPENLAMSIGPDIVRMLARPRKRRPSTESVETVSARSSEPSQAAVIGLSARKTVTWVAGAWPRAQSQRK